ncbi:MAG: DUF2157 domain-containing protein [Patescibacteria group bacterium]
MDQNFLMKLQRISYLKTAIEELQKASTHHLTLDDTISSYKKELINLENKEALAKSIPVPQPPVNKELPGTQQLSNWYKENNILFLLYLGAVMMVLSAIIFVGFNWEIISGLSKTLIMLLSSSVFLVAGLYLSIKSKKLKVAGETFSLIGALSFPLVGVAYYNFIDNSSLSMVSLVTSAISLILYLTLGRFIDKKIYAYLGSLSLIVLLATLDTFIKLTSVTQLKTYLLLTGGFILLLAGKYYTQTLQKEGFKEVSTAYLPILTVITALHIFSEYNKFGTTSIVVLSALVSFYYFLSFYFHKNHEYVFLSISFFHISAFMLIKDLTTVTTAVYVSSLVSLSFILVEEVLSEKSRIQSIAANTFLTAPILLGSIALLQSKTFSFTDVALISLLISFRNIYTYLNYNIEESLVYGNLVLLVSVFHTLKLLPISNHIEVFGLATLLLALINFWIFRQKRNKEIFMYVAMILSGIAFFVTFNSEIYSVIVSLIVSVMFYLASIDKNEEGLAYLALGFLTIAAWRLGNILNISFDGKKLLTSLLIASIVTEKSIKNLTQKPYRYIVPALWTLAYSSLLTVLNVSNNLVFYTPLGIVLLGLSSIEKKENDSNELGFKIAGLTILFLSVVFKAFENTTPLYSLIFAIEGLILVGFGINSNDDLIKKTGAAFVILAVLSQIYEYLLSLPRWLLTSAMGISLLTIGIYLLLKKYQNEQKN